MKNKYSYTRFRIKPVALLLMVLMVALTNCLEKEPQIWASESVDQQIAEYLETNSDRYSEFYEMIVRTDFVHLLRARGPYTLFLPTNEAMQSFYANNGLSSIDDLSLEDMEKLVRNHLFAVIIPSSTIGLGALNDTNALGDFIASEFQGTEIIIAKTSKIIKRDIVNANGYIHVIDKPMVPITENIFEVISKDPQYTIFVEGLKRAGLDEILEIVKGPYGTTEVRIWYTLFAVPDQVYNASSISSVDDLILEYDDGVGQITESDNGFYKYMVYHCLEGVYYLSKMEEGVYPIITRENQVKIDVDTTYKINYNPADSTYHSFILSGTNVSSKNGVIHAIDDQMPAIDPIPARLIIHTTHYSDLQSEDCYLNYIKNFMDGENTFAKIKWQGDYMQYYYKSGQNYMEHDCLSMSQGFWWLEITIPKIPKGKYKISAYFKVGENRANMITYIDDVKMPLLVETRASSKSYETIEIGDVDWLVTEEHRIKFVTLIPGILYIDRFILDPTF